MLTDDVSDQLNQPHVLSLLRAAHEAKHDRNREIGRRREDDERQCANENVLR